ncbi:nucleotide disphospho-sugar-binding domain-containing protein [Promicromonospora soli]
MRVLFSAVPAYGHILPLAPLMEAAIAGGHTVGLLAGEGVRPLVEQELPPGVELLAAGVALEVFVAEAAKRGGGDPLHPTPAIIGETFGGTRLDLDREDALAAGRLWRPDLVVAEAFDTVGPLLAAHLGTPWHQAGLGPGIHAELRRLIDQAAAPHYESAGLEPEPASSYIDPCPQAFQAPGWVSPAPTLHVRARAHRRIMSAEMEPARFSDRTRPTVLLTLGTVFSDGSTLAELAPAVAAAGVNVVATLGPGQDQPPAVSGPGEVHWVSFVPLDQLLDDVDLVVAAGGSGTVLGAMSRGVPMVLYPQGTDQPMNAARADAAGVAVVVGDAAEVTGAVTRALDDVDLRTRAAEIAKEIANAPAPAQVVAVLTEHARR